MARRGTGTGIAVLVGTAIAVGAVVAFASGKKRKAAEADEAEAEEPSPVSPTSVTLPGPAPINVTFPTQSPGLPPVAPPVVPSVPSPGEVPQPVELPDEDEDEEDEPEASAPTVKLPGGIKVEVPKAGTTVTLPGGTTATVPTIPGVTAPATPTSAPVPIPPVPAVEQPSAVPADTAQLVAQMLADEANPTGWKKKYPALGKWQAARGLTADQAFGPGSAKRMAQEIGTLPIVRFWPKGTLPQTALGPYREALQAIAATAPEPRRAQLLMSANREQGQAFGTPPKPITPLVSLKAAAA